MRLRALLSLMLPFLVLAAISPSSLAAPTPSPSPNSGETPKYEASTRVVFHSSRDGGRWQVYVSNLDGGQALNLSNNNAHESYPSVSPDGTVVLVESYAAGATADTTEVVRIGIDGKGRTQLTHSSPGRFAEGGAWSPDGSRIAYALGVVGQAASDVYTMSPTGTMVTQLTHGGDNYSPDWTPDGRIVFVRAVGTGRAISIMDGTGMTVRDLYMAPRVYDPAVSPDGKSIVFAHQTTPIGGPFATEVIVMGIDGSTPSVITPAAVNAGEARFSPDGTQIVFDCARNPRAATPPPDGPYDLCAVPVVNPTPRVLFSGPGDSFAPQLVPILAPIVASPPQSIAPAPTPQSPFPWWLVVVVVGAVAVLILVLLFIRRRRRVSAS